ncbi:MAG: response regulator [Gammaproteobacteria bacterium]|nr:response regulator [Gammaproteobacteria bacterium]
MAIKVLLAEHHGLIRDGIVRMLEANHDLQLVGLVSNLGEMQRQLRDREVDVAILDMGLPPAGALEATHRIVRSYPMLRLVTLGASAQGPYPARLLQAGVHGFVTQESCSQDLVKAIRTVASGKQYISGDAAQHILLSNLSHELSAVSTLSARELSVMVMVSKGLRPQEISSSLAISPKTVSTYRSRACRKLGVKTDVELTHLSLKHGLIDSYV